MARLGTIKLVERSPFVGLGLGFCDAARVLFREAWMKKKNDEDCQCPHYGTKPGHFETSKIHFPTSEGVSEVSERSGGRERSEQSGASERVSGASERANGRASDPVLQSGFLVKFWPTVCWWFRG